MLKPHPADCAMPMSVASPLSSLWRCVLLLTLLPAMAIPARAQSNTSDSGLPLVDQSIYTMLQYGNRLYIGGYFHQVNGVARTGLAAINLDTGQLDLAWNPIVDGSVDALAAWGGKLYAAGTFANAGGSPHANLAAFNLADGLDKGLADPTWNPSTDGYVACLIIDHHRLYAGGTFTKVNGTLTRNHLAAFTLAGEGTGGVDTAWDPNVGGGVYSLASACGRVYAGGQFQTVNGGTTSTLVAAFHYADGVNPGKVDARWRPANLGGNHVDSIIPVPQENRLYIGGSFWTPSGATPSLNSLAVFNLADGCSDAKPDPFWKPYCGGTILDMKLAFGKLFVSGVFKYIGGATRTGLAAFNPADGINPAQIDPWAPVVSSSSEYPFMGNLVPVGQKLYTFKSYENNPLLRYDASSIPQTPEVSVEVDGQSYATGAAVPFGTPRQGSAKVTRTLRVRNQGYGPLNLSGLAVSGIFQLRGSLKPSLAAGEFCDVPLEMATTTTGTQSGNLSFNTNDPDEGTFTLKLSGTVTTPARIEVWQNSYQVVPNGTGKVQVPTRRQGYPYEASSYLTVFNRGGEPLTVYQPQLPHSFAMNTYDQFTSISLQPGSQKSFSIMQHTNQAGSFTGPVIIDSTDPATPSYRFTISGTITSSTQARELYYPETPASGSFGEAVAGVPDANGDGFGDVLVGAPFTDIDTTRSAGRAYLFSGRDGSLLLTLQSPIPQIRANFGMCVAGTPDLNGDGRGDLIISSPFEYDPCYTNSFDLSQGAVYVFSGADGRLLLTLHPEVSYPLYHFTFGESIASVSDMNKDGVPDILVGSHSETTDWDYYSGAVYVFSGRDGSQILRHEEGYVHANEFYGDAVAGVPDLDSDGRGDFVVGAFRASYPGSSGDGAAFVYLAKYGTELGRIFRILKSPNPYYNGCFGWAVAGLPDVDYDGYGDVAVGAPGEQSTSGVAGAGRVYLYSPRQTNPGEYTKVLRTINSPNPTPNGDFGYSLSCGGDMNGDSRPDLLIGAPGENAGSKSGAGCVYVINAQNGTVISRITSPRARTYGEFGRRVAAAPDLDGDGLIDAAIGVPAESVSTPVPSNGLGYLMTSASSFSFNIPAVNITTDPANAPWSLTDSQGHVYSGTGDARITTAALGSLRLTWGALADYDAPQPAIQTITLEPYGNPTLYGQYTRQTGGLRLTLEPADATWTLTDALGRTRCGTGSVEFTDIPVGGATLRWGAYPNCDPPTRQPLALTIKNHVITDLKTAYVPRTGSLVISTWPSDNTWKLILNDGTVFDGDSSGIATGVPAGRIRMVWTGRPNYDAPALNPEELILDGNTTATLTGIYRRHCGRVNLRITPDQAGWTLRDGDGKPHSGHGSVTMFNVPSGSIQVTLDPPPASYALPQSANLSGTLAKDGMLDLSADLLAQTGNLKVTISPARAVTAGAQWRLKGTTTWLNSDSPLNGLLVGTYTIEFKTITGWKTPASVNVTINKNQTSQIGRSYSDPRSAVEGTDWRLY